MNTPITDAFAIKFKTPCGEKYWVPVDIARKLERELDEARDAAKKAKAYKRVLKETNAQLKRERDEARKEMIRWMSIAEGRGRTEDDDTGKAMAKLICQRDEARGQRDRLAAALREVREMCLDKTIELHPDHDLKGTIDECIDISNDALQSLTPNQP